MQKIEVRLMKVSELAAATGAAVITCRAGEDKDVTGMYACDLLSWVMAHAQKGNAWITVHTHVNIVAVALLAEVSCIIVPEGIKMEEATVKRAELEGITILNTALSTYEICCRVPHL